MVYIRTQDAYLPGKIYLKGQGLKAPEDLFLKDGRMYIADTGQRPDRQIRSPDR